MATLSSATGALAIAVGAAVAIGACGLDWRVPDDADSSGGGGGSSNASHVASGGGAPAASGPSGGMGGSGAVPADGGGGGAGGGAGGAASSSSPASSSGSGQPTCDDQPTCEACDECAINAGCQSLFESCLADEACFYLDDCVYTYCASLGDAGCIEACRYEFPDGAALFDAMIVCVVCDECPGTCLAFQALWGC
jgi:hypothetical protein